MRCGRRSTTPGDEMPEKNVFYRLAKRFWFNDFGVYDGHDHSQTAAPGICGNRRLPIEVLTHSQL